MRQLFHASVLNVADEHRQVRWETREPTFLLGHSPSAHFPADNGPAPIIPRLAVDRGIAVPNAVCLRLQFPYLHGIDLVIIVAYLAIVVAIGFWCRKRQKTTRHYFLAGRDLPWWAISGSIVATETSAITFISVPGLVYARGGNFTFLQLVFGYLIGRVVICLVFIPAYFRRNLLTIYELLRSRFGGSVRSLAASLFIVMRTIADGVRLLLTSI